MAPTTYILDKFPTNVRPFYTMPDPDDPRFSTSFDMFVRGQEIVSGGQRIHDYHTLEENIRRLGINPTDMEEYLEGFRLGCTTSCRSGYWP
jgi:aspartyl/asparaginyl-tRNA synthetase